MEVGKIISDNKIIIFWLDVKFFKPKSKDHLRLMWAW